VSADPILPGSTIGILGGGQLGRMTAMAARSMGYRIQVMDPDPSCPARFVVDACFEGGWDDAKAAGQMARGCDVVTLEIEQVSLACLDAVAKHAPMRPGKQLLGIIQDRIAQKKWLKDHGLPVGEYREIYSADDLEQALSDFGNDCFVKSARGGYDGRSQVRVTPETSEAEKQGAWANLGSSPCVAEKGLALEREISVMVARSPSGEMRCFPSATNHHEHQILVWSVLPSHVSAELEAMAQKIAGDIAQAIEVEGLLAVEMFVTRSGELLVNELAPRPHNSYHASEHVRAVCDLPLGSVEILRPAAIANLLGDVWLKGEPRFDRALAVPGVALHLYEKHTPRKGRKMGHLSAIGETPEEAVARVMDASSRL
jgi:5-(carboxyamino)imidazole ribonucleotide synthase